MFPVLIIKSHIIFKYAVYSPQQTVFILSSIFFVLSKTLLPMVPLFHGRKTLTLPTQSCMRLGGNTDPAYHCNKTLKQWLETFSLVRSLGYFCSWLGNCCSCQRALHIRYWWKYWINYVFQDKLWFENCRLANWWAVRQPALWPRVSSLSSRIWGPVLKSWRFTGSG